MDRRTFLTTTAAALGLAGGAGCAGAPEDDEPTETASPTTSPSPTATPPAGPTVDMVTANGDFYFDPIGLFVEPGTTVTWRIESDVHSSTAYAPGNPLAEVRRLPEGAEAWNSGTLTEVGATFSHTFQVEGTYDYFCIPHKSLGMVGRVVLGEPGGPAAGSMPPDGDVPSSETIVQQGTVPYADFTG